MNFLFQEVLSGIIIIILIVKINEFVLKYSKYCIVGVIGAITDFSVYSLLIKFFSINYVVANCFSLFAALIIVYYLQKKLDF